MNIDFDSTTLRNIQLFQDGIKKLFSNYPNFNYQIAREFLKGGIRRDYLPDELYEEITRLNELRKTTIQQATKKAAYKAELLGKTIVPELLDGSSFIPFFEEDVYDTYPAFAVYEFLSWYDLDEITAKKENNSSNKPHQTSDKHSSIENDSTR